MDEMNNLPENQNNEEIKEQGIPVPETVEVNAPVANIPTPKLPVPKLPLIIGGAVAGVAAIAITVGVILGGGGHNHSYGAWNIVDEPTCTVAGVEERVCECNEKETRPVAAFGHTEVVDGAVAPTCTSTGLTEGKHCSECNVVITRQNTIPMVAHTYDSKYDEECNVCGDKRDAECAHVETEVIPGKAATCTATGLTDGTKCKKCGETILAQNVIPLLKHSYYQTYSSDNLYHWFECSVCKDVKDKEEHVIDGTLSCSLCHIKVAPTEGIIYDVSADGTYAEVIDYQGYGRVIIAEEYNGLPVKTIYSYAFSNNDNITSVIIPDSVISIGGGAFEGCDSLTSVVIGDSVSSIGYGAFWLCENLTSVVFPDSLISIGEHAFSECISLPSVILGDNVTSVGDDAFALCYSLKSVVLGDNITSVGEAVFAGCENLTSIVIPDNVTSIGDYAFYGCYNLSSVVIPEGVTSIGYEAFSDTKALTQFENCKYVGSKDNPYFALVEVVTKNLSRYTLHEDTKIIAERVFNGFSRLSSIVIPDSVTSIGYEAFRDCSSLTSVVIGDSVTSIGNAAFYGCDSLASIVIPDSVTSIGIYAFYGCDSLTSVVIGNGVTSIGHATFEYCVSLTSVVIGDSVTSIGVAAFEYCSSLASVVIPDSVTSIGGSAFEDCTSLTSVVIGDSVTTIGEGAFYLCGKIRNVFYTGSEEEWKAITIGLYNSPLTSALRHYNYVPDN